MPKVLSLLIFSFSLKVFANVRGSDLQNFTPTYSGLDFLSVHSSRTLQPLQLNVGAFTKGIYLVRLNANNAILTKKLIVK